MAVPRRAPLSCEVEEAANEVEEAAKAAEESRPGVRGDSTLAAGHISAAGSGGLDIHARSDEPEFPEIRAILRNLQDHGVINVDRSVERMLSAVDVREFSPTMMLCANSRHYVFIVQPVDER